MKRSHASKDQLHEQLQHLEDDWNSYKKSIPRKRHARCIPKLSPSPTSPDSILIDLLNNSPKKLLSSLQHTPSSDDEEWRPKGRCLLEALETCSTACSSGLSHCSGIRSSCSCSNGECSLSSCSLIVEDVGEEKMMSDGRWRVRVLLLVLLCVCMVFAMVVGLISLKEFGFGDQDGEFIVPT
ncbi:hypothetical protein J5N97_007189 [Dioscorea zingiberensis]|uniref:Uncharacterized protein n=1 Tax=Dioscorea zingiberensis TaxID=325984 RepID=A0A9D5HU90_9LILI|nr:hypothetical protein J5N97_007189 [Dioscorea zingiberensis]